MKVVRNCSVIALWLKSLKGVDPEALEWTGGREESSSVGERAGNAAKRDEDPMLRLGESHISVQAT